MQAMSAVPLNLPTLLTELLAIGLWPRNAKEAMAQNLRSLVTSERVRIFAPEESKIYLHAPPFHTLEREVERASPPVSKFWMENGALDQISPALCLVLGDFGLGSDAPIILNYEKNRFNPSVFRLRWCQPRGNNSWVQCASTFDEFAQFLFPGKLQARKI